MNRSPSRPLSEPERASQLFRVKLAATLLLIATATLFLVARHYEPQHWVWSYVAAFASAATVGGLADWYAVVALFRRPLGLPIPHTAIIPRNHHRIAETMGAFIETNFLAPEAVEKKLKEVDFAAQIADWLNDGGHVAMLAEAGVRRLPQLLTAVDQSGWRRIFGERVRSELERLDLAPVAAGLLGAVVEKGRHQGLLDELLGSLDKLLTNEETLAALREKIRKELPAVFNFYRADAYLLRKIVASTTAFVEEARADANHPLRHEFNTFVANFIEQLRVSPDLAARADALKRDLLDRPEFATIADGAWDSLRVFLEKDAIAPNSQVRATFERVLLDIGSRLRDDPAIRGELNRGIVRVLGDFVQTQKSGVGRFIADQVKGWDIDVLIGRVELTVGRDLQYIRFNGALIGGLAGLVLHALEQGMKIQL